MPEWRQATANEAGNTIGARRINGFVSNISNYNTIGAETTFANNMASLLTAKGLINKFVVDVSRAGQTGFLRSAPGNWCNLKNARIGSVPGASSGIVDAAVWIKPPGTSDGRTYEMGCGNDDALHGITIAAGEYSFQMAMSHLA
jgi:cellulase/cellobiase CelA1